MEPAAHGQAQGTSRGTGVMLKPYRVTFRHTVIDVMARRPGHAIQQAMELAGPGSVLLSCLEQGEW